MSARNTAQAGWKLVTRLHPLGPISSLLSKRKSYRIQQSCLQALSEGCFVSPKWMVSLGIQFYMDIIFYSVSTSFVQI